MLQGIVEEALDALALFTLVLLGALRMQEQVRQKS